MGFHVPSGAQEVISRRLQRLDAEVRALLEVASVLGRRFHVELLHHVSEADNNSVLADLQRALDSGIVRPIDALGRYEFAHVLIREFLYESLESERRMKLHRKATVAIEELHASDLDRHLPELAHHHFKAGAAGDRRVAIDVSLRAAETALNTHGKAEAERLYRRALALADVPPVDVEQRDRIELLIQEQIGTGGEAPGTESHERTPTATFKREGDYWTLAYEGLTVRLQDAKGLGYLARLLATPAREIHVLDLATPPTGLVDRSDTGEVIDADARAAYRARLRELEGELSEAEAIDDRETATRARTEMDALAEELTGALGIGGKVRRGGSAAERARVNVTKALRAAIDRITSELPSLGAHLSRAVRTGTYCSYDPDPGSKFTWRL
jgi:hypothetical protein